MKTAICDLGKNARVVLRALERCEPVTVTYRGVERGVLMPLAARRKSKVADHAAFGMWRDYKAAHNVEVLLRAMRKERVTVVR